MQGIILFFGLSVLVLKSSANILPICSIYEILKLCASSCKPEPTCQYRNPTAPEYCNDYLCIKRCECCEGFIRDEETGKCVPIENCPITCGCNEISETCISPCEIEPTCDERDPPQATCLERCRPRCLCRPGYIRLIPGGKCVKIETCPLKCTDANEILNSYASPCNPEPACNNTNPTTPSSCPLKCIQRCECKPGYVRNDYGYCIEAKDCPLKCDGANEILNVCVSACLTEPSCKNKNPTAPTYCHDPCVQKCLCKPGFIRDVNGICIDITLCPLECGLNQIPGSNPCCGPKTCANRYSTCKITWCPAVTQCICKPGYVLNYIGGQCILSTSCPY